MDLLLVLLLSSEILIPFKVNKFAINIAKVRNHCPARFQRQIVNRLIDRLCTIFRKFVFYLYQFLSISFLGNRVGLKVSNVILIRSFESFFNIVAIGSQRANCRPQFLFELPITPQCFIYFFTHNAKTVRRQLPVRTCDLLESLCIPFYCSP